MSPQTVVRICCIRSFGHFVARLQGSILQFNAEVGIFVSIAQSEQESLLQQAQAQFRMVSQAAPPCPLCSHRLTEKPQPEAQTCCGPRLKNLVSGARATETEPRETRGPGEN